MKEGRPHQSKTKRVFRKLCFYLSLLPIAGASIWFFYTVFQALVVGNITFVSKLTEGTAFLAKQPTLYWFGIALYSLFAICGAYVTWWFYKADTNEE